MDKDGQPIADWPQSLPVIIIRLLHVDLHSESTCIVSSLP